MGTWKKLANAREGDLLTRRELEVFSLLAAGHTTPEIARTLGVKDGTIKSHLSIVYKKIGVRNRIQALLHYLEHYGQAGETASASGEAAGGACSIEPCGARASHARRPHQAGASAPSGSANADLPTLDDEIRAIEARLLLLEPIAEEAERLRRQLESLRAITSTAPRRSGPPRTKPRGKRSERTSQRGQADGRSVR